MSSAGLWRRVGLDNIVLGKSPMPHQAADTDITLPKIKTPPSEQALLAMFMAGQALGADG